MSKLCPFSSSFLAARWKEEELYPLCDAFFLLLLQSFFLLDGILFFRQTEKKETEVNEGDY
jgi:hypothetical protein